MPTRFGLLKGGVPGPFPLLNELLSRHQPPPRAIFKRREPEVRVSKIRERYTPCYLLILAIAVFAMLLMAAAFMSLVGVLAVAEFASF